jgi:hypothetical protein
MDSCAAALFVTEGAIPVDNEADHAARVVFVMAG